MYMPGASLFRNAGSTCPTSSTPELPENELLYLPSSLPPSVRQAMCVHNLADKEFRLRLGQVDDALNAVHRQLRIASTIIKFKKGQHYASQNLTCKMRSLMDKFNVKTHLAAVRYQAAFAALSDLHPNGDWTQRYQPLDLKVNLHLLRRELDNPYKGRNQGENQ